MGQDGTYMSERLLLFILKKPSIVYLKKKITNLRGRISSFCRDQEKSDELDKSVKPLTIRITIVDTTQEDTWLFLCPDCQVNLTLILTFCLFSGNTIFTLSQSHVLEYCVKIQCIQNKEVYLYNLPSWPFPHPKSSSRNKFSGNIFHYLLASQCLTLLCV